MVLKIRVDGTKEEIDWFVLGLRKTYDVRSVSKFYPNRGGETFRVYVEVFPFFVRSGSTLDSKNEALLGQPLEPTPRPGDVVLGGNPLTPKPGAHHAAIAKLIREFPTLTGRALYSRYLDVCPAYITQETFERYLNEVRGEGA